MGDFWGYLAVSTCHCERSEAIPTFLSIEIATSLVLLAMTEERTEIATSLALLAMTIKDIIVAGGGYLGYPVVGG